MVWAEVEDTFCKATMGAMAGTKNVIKDGGMKGRIL